MATSLVTSGSKCIALTIGAVLLFLAGVLVIACAMRHHAMFNEPSFALNLFSTSLHWQCPSLQELCMPAGKQEAASFTLLASSYSVCLC